MAGIGSLRIDFTLLCAAGLLGLSACSDDDEYDYERPRPNLTTGTLEVHWSIEGRTDAEVCDEVGVVAFRMDLYDQGYFVGGIDVPCADFTASVELYSDDYLSRATLVNEDDIAILRRVVEDYFEIDEGLVTRLDIDFPSAAGNPMQPQDDAGAPPADGGAEPTDEGPDAAPPAPADAAAADAGAQ